MDFLPSYPEVDPNSDRNLVYQIDCFRRFQVVHFHRGRLGKTVALEDRYCCREVQNHHAHEIEVELRHQYPMMVDH